MLEACINKGEGQPPLPLNCFGIGLEGKELTTWHVGMYHHLHYNALKGGGLY